MAKQPNTLFNRVNYLRCKINRFYMKKLGQLVKDAYVEKFNLLPNKISLTMINKLNQPVVRSIAVYPDEFLPTMDKIILNYARTISPKKRPRIHSKYSNTRQAGIDAKR